MHTGEMLVCQRLFDGHLCHFRVRAVSLQIHELLRPVLDS